jgi:hypothetical protein
LSSWAWRIVVPKIYADAIKLKKLNFESKWTNLGCSKQQNC